MKLQPVPVASNERVFIGTIGYHLLTNHSVGPILLPQLQRMDWPDGIDVDELNWGPVAVVQQFQVLPRPYQRVILLGAINRAGRAIGDIDVFQWCGGLPEEQQIQACMGDAATGVISVENLLIIGEYFKIWPREVFLIDVEPGAEVAGERLTAEVQAKVPEILETVQQLALYGRANDRKVGNLRAEDLFL